VDVASRNVVVCAAGLKGAQFVEGLIARGIKLDKIISYDQADDKSRSFDKLQTIAKNADVEFQVSKRPQFSEDDLLFVVGWQFLFQDVSRFCVVFHDSLLPKYRGFAPTVTALLNGENEIGVTALSPARSVDDGPIVGQLSAPVKYPMKIAAALEIQAGLMVNLAIQIYRRWSSGVFVTREQDHSAATYSVWRDEEDYFIDWSQSSSSIIRMIDAVGFPYAGARTTVAGEVLVVESATEVDDLMFELRQPGKVWALDEGRPLVICGTGLVRLDECRRLDGDRYDFRRLRVRLTN
jgi:methionyl-tRNA formyltransferase